MPRIVIIWRALPSNPDLRPKFRGRSTWIQYRIAVLYVQRSVTRNRPKARPRAIALAWGIRSMMKFILAARRKPEDTQERYFYEWGIIHVALMITNPSTQRAFQRYTQHFSINEISNDWLWHPLSPLAWGNMADHWLKSLDDLVASVHSLDYIQRMQPHKFGDSHFAIELTAGRVMYEDPKFANG